MKLGWTKGKNEIEAKDIRASFTSSVVMRRRLEEMLKEKLEKTYSTADNEYENPNWAFKQADSVGYRRALKDILNLLS